MIGKRLRLLRQQKSLTQLELARRLNIPNQNISNYEREFRSPDLSTVIKFADFFNVTTDYLLCRTDEPQPINITNRSRVENSHEFEDILTQSKTQLTTLEKQRLIKLIGVFLMDLEN